MKCNGQTLTLWFLHDLDFVYLESLRYNLLPEQKTTRCFLSFCLPKQRNATKLTQRALHGNLALRLLLPLRHVALDEGLANGDLDAGRDAERGAAELGRAGCRRGEVAPGGGGGSLLESRHEETGESDDGGRGRGRGSGLKDPPSAWGEHRDGGGRRRRSSPSGEVWARCCGSGIGEDAALVSNSGAGGSGNQSLARAAGR